MISLHRRSDRCCCFCRNFHDTVYRMPFLSLRRSADQWGLRCSLMERRTYSAVYFKCACVLSAKHAHTHIYIYSKREIREIDGTKMHCWWCDLKVGKMSFQAKSCVAERLLPITDMYYFLFSLIIGFFYFSCLISNLSSFFCLRQCTSPTRLLFNNYNQ